METTCTAFQLFSSCDSGSSDGQILTNAKHNVRVSGQPTWHKGTLGSFFPPTSSISSPTRDTERPFIKLMSLHLSSK